jgi:hypothetical protein
MRTRSLLLAFLALPLSGLLFACSSSGDDTPTSATSPSTGGASGTGGAGQGGSGQAASGGTAAAGSSQGGQAGSSQGGAGQGGTGTAGTGTAGAGQAGSGQAGSGGTTGCCQPSTCGDEQMCVEGSCFDLKPGECFTSAQCNGAPCLEVIICGCGDECFAPTTPGHCQGSPAWAKCGAPGDCTLAANSCCGTCGVPGLADVDAIHKGQNSAHFSDVCKEPDPLCPDCLSGINPDLLAVCALGLGQCTAVEVSKSPLSACKSDDDCLLRATKCCACGQISETSLVAISKAQEPSYLSELGCSLVDCGPCQTPPTPPPGHAALCNLSTGHCAIAVAN